MVKFIFWSSVGVVSITASFLLIRWMLKKETERNEELRREADKKSESVPRREMGFHAIAKDWEAQSA
jgi:hypothetical protein